MLTVQSMEMKEKMNSDVRELNKGACTQGACMRARLEMFINHFF